MKKQRKKEAPPWADEDAVYELVQAEVKQAESERDRQLWAFHAETAPRLTWDEHARSVERDALDAWRRGYRKPFINLLLDDYPEHAWFGRPIRDQLSDEAWSIIRDSLMGKAPLKRGRPKMTADDRRMHNPVHDAADMVPAIENILLQLYPEQSAKQVKDRACAFAERLIMGIDDPDSAGNEVSDYLNRSKKDRTRLP